MPFQTELRKRKQLDNSKLVLYGGEVSIRLFFFIICCILLGFIYVGVLILAGFNFTNNSTEFWYTLANFFNTVIIGFILLFAILLIIVAIKFFYPALMNRNMTIDQSTIQIHYFIFIVPFFKRSFNTSEGKIVVNTGEEEKAIKPVIGRERMFLVINDQKYFIRSFLKTESDQKLPLVNLLYHFGLSIDPELMQQIPSEEIQEDLDLDLSLD